MNITQLYLLQNTLQLRDYAKLLDAEGIRTYWSRSSDGERISCGPLPTYMHFGDDTGVGYVQISRGERISFSTVNRSHRDHGTGYALGFDKLTVEAARTCMASYTNGYWKNRANYETLSKFESIDTWLQIRDIIKPIPVASDFWTLPEITQHKECPLDLDKLPKGIEVADMVEFALLSSPWICGREQKILDNIDSVIVSDHGNGNVIATICADFDGDSTFDLQIETNDHNRVGDIRG